MSASRSPAFELFLPKSSPPFPLLCVTPILGRLLFLPDLFFERHFARLFAAHGFAAALVDRPIFEFDPGRGLDQIQAYLDDSVLRNTRALDRILAENPIDAERIGTFGISFGAVVNLLWAASDSRLKAHVFALAGGNLSEVCAASRDPLMRTYLKALQSWKQASPEGAGENLRTALGRAFRADPLDAAASVSRESVFMILALFDRVIRFRYGLALWRALRKPRALFLPLGHYTSILALPLIKRRVLRFFEARLGPSSPS